MLSRATGKRKSSVARVILKKDVKGIVVNGKDVKEYFGRESSIKDILKPLVLTEQEGKLGVVASIYGGGKSGQAGALRHGITKALLEINAGFRAQLKPAKLITRDSRVVETKKAGRRKARRKRQFSKR